MINASREFKEKLKSGANIVNYADVTLDDGTVLHLEPKDFMIGGCSIDDKTTDGKFGVGFCIGKTLAIKLSNHDERFSQHDFYGATIHLYVATLMDDSTIEKLRKGIYYAMVPSTPGDIIQISAMDGMYRLDRDYSASSTIYPATLQTILTEACLDCGIPIGFRQFDNMGYIVQSRPEKATYRQVVSWAAQIAGYNARIDNAGYMQLIWYNTGLLDWHNYNGGDFRAYPHNTIIDGGNFINYSTGLVISGGTFTDEVPEHIFRIKSLDVHTDDVQITGVRVVGNDDASALFGEEGYVIEVKDNPFTAGKERAVADYLGVRMVGMMFRPFSAQILNNPLYEPFDIVRVSDKKGNTYNSLINSVSYTVGSYTQIACEAEDPLRNGSTYFSEAAAAVAESRKKSEKQLTEYDKAVQNMNQLAGNALGYHTTYETQPDGSRITYLHDKPDLKDSKTIYKQTIDGFFISTDGGKTYTAGFDSQGNVVVNILYAIGIVADWIRTGRFQVRKGDTITFLADADTGEVQIVADSFSLSSGDTIDSIAQDKADSALDDAKKYADKSSQDAVEAQTQLSIFNKLTNDGQTQGIYLKDRKVYINGTYIQTGTISVKKGDKTTFLANTDTGEVRIVADSFSLSSGQTIDSIAQGKVDNFVTAVYDPKIASLQSQIDGQIETWYYDHEPTLSNAPASSWKTDVDRAKHEGDLFYWKSKGYSYRFFKDGNVWKWQLITDSDITKALADAAAAQDTADNKRRVFVSTPKPPYDIGDLWVQGASGDIMRCQVARKSGNYATGDWIKASKYTDDSALNAFIDGEFQESISDLQTQADKKAETWYQASDPSTAWTTTALKNEHKGDMWFNSTSTVQKTYRWTGTKWEEMKTTPPPAVFDQIDGKAQVFVSTPKPPYDIGDLWFNSSTSDIMTCVTKRSSGNYVASDWQKRNKYIDQTAADTAANNAVNAQTQADIFNRLTNNGELQGIYMQNGRLYINATYMVTGKISSKDGRVYFDLDKSELRCDRLVSKSSNSTNANIIGYIGRTVLGNRFVDGFTICNTTYEQGLIAFTPGDSNSKPSINVNEEGMSIYSRVSHLQMKDSGVAGISTSANGYVLLYGGRKASNPPTDSEIENAANNIRGAYIMITPEAYASGTAIYSLSKIYVRGDTHFANVVTMAGLEVTGPKSRIANTKNYGIRSLYCYEMPSPMFGDIGEAMTDENGKCYVYLDDIFAETVTAEIEYQVFLQKEGPGDVWIEEKTPVYFLVRGTENLKFAWEIKARQTGFEFERLENKNTKEAEPINLESVESNYADEINQIIKMQEDMLYETT